MTSIENKLGIMWRLLSHQREKVENAAIHTEYGDKIVSYRP